MIVKNELKYLNVTETRDYIREKTTDRKKVQLDDLRRRAKIQIDSKSDLYSYDIVIQTDDDYYFELNFIENSIELYNNSTIASYVYSEFKKIGSKKSNGSLCNTLTNSFGAYMIPLFGNGTLFINSDVAKTLLEEVKKISAKNCITKKEIIEKIRSTYVGYSSKHIINKRIDDIVDELGLEFIPATYKYNILTTNASLYPEKTVEKLLEHFNNEVIRKEISLVNISFEDYLSLSIDDFENNYKEFTKDDAERIAWNSSYFNESTEINRHFKNTNVRIFKVNNQGVYVNKKDLDELANLIKDYELARLCFEESGLKFDPNIASTNGIDFIKYRQMCYVKKTDIELYKTVCNYNKTLKETESLYGRVKLKIDTFPHDKDANYPNVKNYILKFAKNSDRSTDDASPIYRLYENILENIKFDLVPHNQSKNNELFCSILNNFENNDKMSKFTIGFMNFLRDKEGFNLMIAQNIKPRNEKVPYTPEEFINLLSVMLTITSNEEKLSKLYRDWRLSTSFSYVFLHYCLAWRRTDLVDNLPMVNLSLVSNDITDGESFIKWLEEGNKLSYKQSKYICESLEEETRRLRKKASKNDILLTCIISDALMCEVATLLCINEANRQIYFKENGKSRSRTRRDRCFLKPYTDPGAIYNELSEKLDININEILNGSFDNTRMNKGFLHLVRDKAEELNLFAYTHVQLLRSHKSTDKRLSETTKIYLNKTVDRSSLLAFSTGTMGSVLYLLKQLVDNDFNFKSINEQIEDINNLNITPYELEKNIQYMNNKITTLNNEMKRYFANQGTKENFLERLLYGQTFSGIEEKTKCLIKIVRDEENMVRISPVDSEKTTPNNKCPRNRRSCIGCEYMIALRYFIYEFENKYNQVLTNLENAKSKLDKEIFTQMINTLYVPLLNDLSVVLGEDKIYEIVDLDRYLKLAQSH